MYSFVFFLLSIYVYIDGWSLFSEIYGTGFMDLRSIPASKWACDPVLLESENIYGEPMLVEMIWGAKAAMKGSDF